MAVNYKTRAALCCMLSVRQGGIDGWVDISSIHPTKEGPRQTDWSWCLNQCNLCVSIKLSSFFFFPMLVIFLQMPSVPHLIKVLIIPWKVKWSSEMREIVKQKHIRRGARSYQVLISEAVLNRQFTPLQLNNYMQWSRGVLQTIVQSHCTNEYQTIVSVHVISTNELCNFLRWVFGKLSQKTSHFLLISYDSVLVHNNRLGI